DGGAPAAAADAEHVSPRAEPEPLDGPAAEARPERVRRVVVGIGRRVVGGRGPRPGLGEQRRQRAGCLLSLNAVRFAYRLRASASASPVTNAVRSAANRSGSSQCSAWPVPPYTKSREPGMDATRAS